MARWMDAFSKFNAYERSVIRNALDAYSETNDRTSLDEDALLADELSRAVPRG